MDDLSFSRCSTQEKTLVLVKHDRALTYKGFADITALGTTENLLQGLLV